MVNEKEFFNNLTSGNYANIPKALYNLFILAVNNQDKEELVVRKYTRPTLMEDAVFLYKLQGLRIETEVNTKKFWSVFTRSYKIRVTVPAFLANLSIFYQTTQEELQNKYEVAETKRSRNKDPQHPRDREILLFNRKITSSLPVNTENGQRVKNPADRSW